MTGYEKYLKAINNVSPMSFQDWKIAVGISEDEVTHTPLTIRPKKDSRPIKPTFDNHVKVERPKKIKVERTPRKKMSDEEKALSKNERRKLAHRKNPNFKEKASLKDMTREELLAHRAKQQRERILKKKKEGTFKKRIHSEEQRQKRNIYFASYYEKNKDNEEFIAKRKNRRIEKLNSKDSSL